MIKKNKILKLLGFFAMSCIGLGIGDYIIPERVQTAAADMVATSPYCLTYGTTIQGGNRTAGSPDNFDIYMKASRSSGEETIYNGYLSNWSKYYVIVDDIDVTEHLSLELYKGDSIYESAEIPSDGDFTANFGTLDSGVYTIKYECRYKKNMFTADVYYTYEYIFEVDVTKPSYTLSEATGSLGYCTNQNVYYSASDTNLSRIAYRHEANGNLIYTLDNSVEVLATEENNGFWFFQAFDKLGNASAMVNRYIDTVAPIGIVTNQDGDTIASGSATREAFIYTATDVGTVARIEYKMEGDTFWTAYPSDVSILTKSGWYYFRAIDGAGNVSDEYRVIYDVTAPLGCVYDSDSAKGSGSITNKSYIKYVATDAESGIAKVYVQKPGSTSFTSYINGSQLTEEGTYKFKAYDEAGNVTEATHEITLDKTAPMGKLMVNGATMASGSCTSQAFSYTATDALGIMLYRYKLPNSSSWLTYTPGMNILDSEGWYYFQTIDLAGNISIESKIFYDVTAPDLYLVGGECGATGQVQESGAVVNTECIRVTAVDVGAGVKAIYVSRNGGAYTSYTGGTELTVEAEYAFYAINNAGLSTATYYITLDKTSPEGMLYADGIKVASGTITNAEKVMYITYDSLSGLQSSFVKKPNTSEFVNYLPETELSQEGTYEFYSVDYAGNQSAISTITVNRSIPMAQLFVAGKAVQNGTYTNGQYISFESNGTCFVKKPSAKEFVAYLSGTEFFNAGRYEFYAESPAGTITETYVVIIDREPETIMVNRLGGTSWNEYSLSWLKWNPNENAPVERITINGCEYEFGTTLYTLAGKDYEIIGYDAAGNTYSTTVKGGTVDIPTITIQKNYWEVNCFGESSYYNNYEDAVISAMSMERAMCTFKTWNTESWDQGVSMDTKDSVNAKNGTYYLYKSEEDANKQVAYFTEERLNEVMRKYAEKKVEVYYYWENPSAVINNFNFHAYPNENKIVATEIQLREGFIYKLDGAVYGELMIDAPGAHSLTIEDYYGGSVEYKIYILDRVATIQYALGDNSFVKAEFDRTYFLSGKVSLSVPFEGDDLAMLVVYRESGIEVGRFDIGDMCIIEESGSYTAVSYNHYGKSNVFSFVVSMDEPTISVNENAEKKKLEIAILDSVDRDANITFIEIAKSTDGGETWFAVLEDDYGRAIYADCLSYNFRTSGMYKITIMDEFRTGIDAIICVLQYSQPEPECELEGVENGGYTNGSVAFVWDDEVKVQVKKDGVIIEYVSGRTLTEDGNYKISVENFDGYKAVYSFTIDKLPPVIEVEGASHREAVNANVKVFYTEENLTAELYKDGKMLGYYISGNPISADGAYRVRVYDVAGNEVSVEFTIDKTVSYDINVYDKGLSNSVVVTAQEMLTTELTKNGKKVDYALGSAIVEPADYTLVLIDTLGNKEAITFRVINPLVQEFTHNFDDIEGFGGVLVNGADKRLNYGTLELFEDGRYEVGVIVGGKTYSFAVTVDNTAPVLALNGVGNGGGTKGSVTLSNLSEKAVMKVYFNNVEIEYELGEELTELGKYRVLLTDEAGNETAYEFEILYKMNGGTIALIVIGLTILFGVILSIVLGKRATYKERVYADEEDDDDDFDGETIDNLGAEESAEKEGETP